MTGSEAHCKLMFCNGRRSGKLLEAEAEFRILQSLPLSDDNTKAAASFGLGWIAYERLEVDTAKTVRKTEF